MKNKKRGETGNMKVLIIALALLAVAVFVGAVSYVELAYTSNNGFFTNTSGNSTGVLSGTNLSGTYDSFIFYNTSAAFWAVKLGLIGTSANRNISLQTRTSNNYNISDKNLKGFWAFNNASNENTTFWRDEKGINNGTCGGGANCPKINLTSSIADKSLTFDKASASDYVSISSTETDYTGNISFSAWTKVRSGTSTAAHMILSHYQSGAAPGYGFAINVGITGSVGNLLFYTDTAGWQASSGNASDNKWHHTAFVYNDTKISMYLDGSRVFSGTASAPSASTFAAFGAVQDGNLDAYFNGEMDEIRFYNRSLNDTEITNLYNLGSYHISDWSLWNNSGIATNAVSLTSNDTGKFMQYRAVFAQSDTAGQAYLTNHTVNTNWYPNVISVILNSTNVLSNETSQNLTCYANITDVDGGSVYGNFTWYKDGVANKTGISSAFNAGTIGTVSMLTGGNFTYNTTWNCSVRAYDGWSLNATSMNSSSLLILDLTLPNATLVLPANGSYNATLTLNLTATLTDESSGVKNATLFVYNLTAGANQLINQTDLTGFAAGTLSTSVGIVVNLVDGIYNWFYSLFDFAGNKFTGGNNTLTIDTVFPVVNFTNPTARNYSAINGNLTVNISIIETNLANVTWNWNGSITIYNILDNSSYFSGSAPNYGFNLSQSGLTASFYYYNITITDKAGNSNRTESRAVKGNTASFFYLVNNTPNTSRTLDPGVNITITVNISDGDYNLQTVLLKWKNSSATWAEANSTAMQNQSIIPTIDNMASNSTIFNVSISAYSYDHNLSYMITVNDSTGTSVNSSIINLTVVWDCTWNITASGLTYNTFGSVSGYDVLRKYVGNITLTNTGDPQFGEDGCNISVGLSHALTPPSRMCLDGRCYSSSNAINLNARTNYTALINATFYAPSTPTSEAFTVIATNTNIESALAAMNATGTLVTSQAGPYLIQEVTSSSSLSVYLTSGNISLEGYLQNVMGSTLPNDTNTAFNVTFNWTLPSASGLTNVSGNLSTSFVNISDSSYHYNNIKLTFSDLASAVSGTKIIYLYSSGINQTGGNITDASNRTVLSNTVNITFLCYNVSDSVCVTACGNSQDPDCTVATTTTTVTTTSGGGGATGGGGSVAKSEATVELTRGKEQEFELEIKNKYPGAMKKIKISVSGINQEYITIIPNTIDSIPGYSSKKFKVKITAPAYFSGKKYTLYFDIVSKLESATGLTDLSERKVVTLYIFEFSREEADAFVNETQAFLEEMNASGLNVKEISKLLETINTNYADSNFLSIKTSYDKAKEIYNNAIESNKLIEDLKSEMKNAEARGISTIETKKMLYIAEAAFERGDYSLALERLKEARLTFALETKGEFNLAYAIKNNLLESFGILIGLGLFSVGSMLFVRFQIYKRKLRALKEEEILLLELMKILQKECFEKNHMSLEEYESAMSQYETRLSETVEERIKIETKVANMLKIKGRRIALDEEKKRLTLMVMKIQDDYLNKGKIETRIYENMIKSYTKRLSEVQEEIATMEAESAIKRDKKIRGMFSAKK